MKKRSRQIICIIMTWLVFVASINTGDDKAWSLLFNNAVIQTYSAELSDSEIDSGSICTPEMLGEQNNFIINPSARRLISDSGKIKRPNPIGAVSICLECTDVCVREYSYISDIVQQSTPLRGIEVLRYIHDKDGKKRSIISL